MTPSRYALLAGLLLLAGCTSGTTIYYSDNYTRYYPEFVRHASASGEMAMEVYGSPFGSTDAGSASAIASGLKMPPGFGEARFTTTPDPKRAKQRVVLVFNAVHPSPGGDAVCGNLKAIQLGPTADPMRVEMALCSSGDWVSQATVVGPRGSSPNDPAFRKTVEDGLFELIPYLNHSASDGCGGAPC